jgi:biotin carboxyl carrier protein
MLYQVTIGERVLAVRLRRDGERTFASIDDGPEQPVRMDAVRGYLRSLVVGDQRSELLARRDGQSVEIALRGAGFQAEVMDETHARLAQVASARGTSHGRRDLKAPMPGLVVKVLVEPGQEVTPGQPLVVLQAMKMENELSLPAGGKISKLGVTEGQTVEAGQVLATLE